MKKSAVFRRLCGLLLAAVFALTPTPPVSAANYPKIYSKISSSYKSSVYYQKPDSHRAYRRPLRRPASSSLLPNSVPPLHCLLKPPRICDLF